MSITLFIGYVGRYLYYSYIYGISPTILVYLMFGSMHIRLSKEPLGIVMNKLYEKISSRTTKSTPKKKKKKSKKS